MRRSTHVSIALTIVVVLGALAALVVAEEPAIARRIVAVGDIHGDAEQLRAILQMAGVVDANGNWVKQAVNTTVVQVGDMLDRGEQDKESMDALIHLKETAPLGCEVVVLLGNHELMNLQGQLHYVHPKSNAAFGGTEERKSLVSKEGKYGRFLRSLPLAHVDMGTLFVHAGLLPDFARVGVDGLNAKAAKALEEDNFKSSIFGVNGPVWTRRLVNEAAAGSCELVEESLNLLGLKRMVVGHTPQRSKRPGVFCDEKLLVIDVGMSKWMLGGLAALEMAIPAGEPEDAEPYIYEVMPGRSSGEVETETSATKPVEDAPGKDGENAAVDDEALKAELLKDSSMLQEMLDTLQEYRKGGENEGENDASNDKPQSYEL